jgi:hypothetical protein
MNADVTPMNADYSMIPIVGRAGRHSSSSAGISAFIGVTSAFIGVSKTLGY